MTVNFTPTKCDYPHCPKQAMWIPVVELPTLRFSTTKQEFVKTDKPTLLADKRHVCQDHKENYNFEYWFPNRTTWAKIQDVARSQGFKIDDLAQVVVRFMPLSWKPTKEYMELERQRMPEPDDMPPDEAFKFNIKG